ncbi:MAG: hypothetical protein ACHQQ3_04200 [Gemmatimonadales bacterium]
MTLHAFALLLSIVAQQGSDTVVARAKDAIRPLVDSASLAQAGYMPLRFGPVRDLTPMQGQHWLSIGRIIANQPVDLAHPTFVMYLPVRDSLIPVGVAYSRRIGGNLPAPTDLVGTAAEWHNHVFCRGVPGEGQVLADGIEDCRQRGGNPTPNQITMVHTWTIPNPDGPYAHDNPSLPYIATGLKPPAMPTKDDRLFAVALGETYGAKLPEAHRIEREASLAGTVGLLQQYRQALRELVPQLQAAEKANDKPKFEALRKKAISAWSSLVSTYHALATSPEMKARFDIELEQVLGGPEMHHHGGGA